MTKEYDLNEIFDFVTDKEEWNTLVKTFKIERMIRMEKENTVTCPHCKKIVKPNVIKNGKMLFAVECPLCGYDMKSELLEQYHRNEG